MPDQHLAATALPAGLAARYADREWTPITVGRSGAGVWHLAARRGGAHLVLKAAPAAAHPDPGFHPIAEAERTDWARGRGLPAAEVVESGSADGTEWMVATALPGRTAAEPWPDHQRAGVVDALAGFLRELHALPVADCPFRRDADTAVRDAERAAALGLVDEDDFDGARRGRTAVSLLGELLRTRPEFDAPPVVAHGDFCVPNVLLDPETLRVTGVIDLGRLGAADRHQDLAPAHRSLGSAGLNPQYGGALADRFLRSYGGGAGAPELMAWHRLLDEFF